MMSEAGRTTAARLVHGWQRFSRTRTCAGKVQVHLDGAATCGGKCEDLEKTYHAARPVACRGKRGPAHETCPRCTGRADLDLSSLVGTASSVLQLVDGMRRILTPSGA
jgi:hypothetical protein